MEINTYKTNTMIFNHQYTTEAYPKTIAKIRNPLIANVTKFKYLGCNIKYDEPSTVDTELEMRIDTAKCKFYELGKNLMYYKIMLKARIKVIDAIVRSRLTYSSQTCNLTKRQTDHLNASYVSMLRKMVKGGYRRKPGT